MLFFQEQYFFPCLIKKGIFLYHFFGAVAILGTFYKAFSLIKEQFFTSKVFQSILLFLFVILLVTLFSSNVLESIKYWFVIMYGVCFLISFYISFRDVKVKTILLLTSTSLFISSLVGFYDFIALYFGWITFNRYPDFNKVVSGFLYFGNTADYVHLMLSLILPFLFSKFHLQLSKNEILFLSLSSLLGICMLIGTTRVSVIISFLVSVILLVVLNFRFMTKKKLMYFFMINVGFLSTFFLMFPSIVSSIRNRVELRILQRKPNDLAGNFFIENIEKSLQIFKKYPLTGIGLGQSQINVTNQIFNVHGTYFRLLAETGILGCLSFILVVFSVFYFIFKKIPKQNKKESFFYQFLPFMIGIFISSVYNIHFFRVEFWFFLAVVFLLNDGLTKENLEEKKAGL